MRDGPDSEVTLATAGANGFETLSIVSTCGSPNTLDSLTAVTGTTLETLVVTGDQDWTIRSYPGTIQNVDQAGHSGVLYLGP